MIEEELLATGPEVSAPSVVGGVCVLEGMTETGEGGRPVTAEVSAAMALAKIEDVPEVVSRSAGRRGPGMLKMVPGVLL